MVPGAEGPTLPVLDDDDDEARSEGDTSLQNGSDDAKANSGVDHDFVGGGGGDGGEGGDGREGGGVTRQLTVEESREVAAKRMSRCFEFYAR